MASNARDASPADKEQINEMEARALQERLDAEQIDAFIAEEFANLDEENEAFDEELAKVTATERLTALRSIEYRLAAQQAEKAAKAVEAAETARQLAARQLAEKQKPQKQPSKKQPSKKQPSKKQPSKKKDPSPSSVIDANLGLEDLDDLELAILRSLDDDIDEGRGATEKPFEAWINEYSEEYPARAKLYNLFNGRGWSVVNPRGDGFCGLYVAAIDFQNNHAPNTDPRLVERVHEVSRDGLIELIIDGMKKYYEARNRHIELGIRIPSELADNKYFNVDDTTHIDDDGDLGVSEDNFIVTEELLVNDEDTIRAKLRVLERLGNTPEALFVYLPYIYKRSYLILSYDGRNPDTPPYLTTFMPCLADVRRDARGNAIYPYGGFTNSALMFNNGHYFLLHNTNSDIKADVITDILANKFSDEPIRLWQNIFAAEGRRLRKRKVGTQKRRTKKVVTQKPRPHRSLRRKHKPKTHTLKKH
jgi:hypothetical protein